MSDQTQTDPTAENATLRATLAALQADNARLLSESQIVAKGANESQAALAAAIRDRDAFKGQVDTLRETALVEALRVKHPGADALAIRGVVATLAEAGKINRYPEDPAAELAKALPIIATEAPSLTRPPTSGGGSTGVRQQAAAPTQTVSLFRPTPKP